MIEGEPLTLVGLLATAPEPDGSLLSRSHGSTELTGGFSLGNEEEIPGSGFTLLPLPDCWSFKDLTFGDNSRGRGEEGTP